ncbi:hypothetical protein [uncultured Thiothrix sp.]|uniref:hypothetical protein n=1 Tax=uncultured Thiothrix sp. TaxID=223185 RepID=UPI003451AD9D
MAGKHAWMMLCASGWSSIKQLSNYLERREGRLNNPLFADKAPAAVFHKRASKRVSSGLLWGS